MAVFDRNRRPIVCLAVRKLKRQGKIDRATMQAVLDDGDLQDAILAEAEIMRAAEAEDGAVGGTLTDLFSWLIENQDKIIAFIQKLISLFTV